MNKKLTFVAAAGVLSVIFGTIYAVYQQVIRLTADDPQIQLALDAADQLDQGVKPDDLLGQRVDVDKSLSPAIIIYDTLGQVVVGSAYLGDTIPTIPFGVLQNALNNRYNAITWEPSPGVRLASVSVEANDYFVTAVRSMSEVEDREAIIYKTVALGWLVSLAGLAAVYYFMPNQRTKTKRR